MLGKCLVAAMMVGTLFGGQEWCFGPFTREDAVNPIIQPRPEITFRCPVLKRGVHWESDHTFNPAAVVHEGKVYLLYRAEDDSGTGIGGHCSRIGIAVSDDGLHFERSSAPVLFPTFDDQFAHEWPGGCEDPRVVKREDGTFVMMYTQWNREMAVLSVASSTDLLHWKKHGYAFHNITRRYCKSGAIVCRQEGDELIATKINGKYWMYWGEGSLQIATSDDLISWEPILDSSGNPKGFVAPRPDRFDSGLVEAGPPAVVTKNGIVCIYNGKSDQGAGAYSAGQLLFDKNDPTKLLARMDDCFLKPEKEYETCGQYKGGTVFTQGLVSFQGKWLLYYGTADSSVAVASTIGKK